ncbi:MAG TPA: hypothetical protein VF691_10300 [Cytophagaceae bacterium]|jgi:hypothetical protein
MGGISISHIFYRIVVYVLLALPIVACNNDLKKKPSSSLYCTLPNSEFINGDYSAHKAYQAPILDGKYSENSWAFANRATVAIAGKGDSVGFNLRYKISWDDEALYILMESARLNEISQINLKIDTLSLTLSGINPLIVKSEKILEGKIFVGSLKNEVTLPIQFIYSSNGKVYVSKQGYLKLAL